MSASAARSKQVSCTRCRLRKIRCSRVFPCTSCESAQAACHFTDEGAKRRPVSQDYIRALRGRISSLETLVARLRTASAEERGQILALPDSPTDHAQDSTASTSAGPSSSPHARHLRIGSNSSMSCHGQTSVFHIGREAFATPDDPPSGFDGHVSNIVSHFRLEAPQIDRAVQAFFQYQYSQHMFIYREAFLRDGYAPQGESQYWSPELLYAVAALGALPLDATTGDDLGERCYAAAETIVLVTGLAKPRITTIQALLCLAFYQTGRGNLSKSWALSGMAFRMGQDLGLNRDPKRWVSIDRAIVSDEDVEIRRRIYWGCFISDKVVSMMLGRTPSLTDDDATVGEVQPLPDPEWAQPWLPVDCTDGASRVLPAFRELGQLAKIMQRVLRDANMAVEDSPLTNCDLGSSAPSLNLELCRWEDSLSADLKWNRWQPSTKDAPSHVLSLHLLANCIRMCINWESACDDFSTSDTMRDSLFSAVANVETLVRRYQLKYTLGTAPLIYVYATVRAASALSNMSNQMSGSQAPSPPDERLRFLVRALDEFAPVWKLATQAKARLQHASIS